MTPNVLVALVTCCSVALMLFAALKRSRVDLTVDDDALRVRITGMDARFALCRGMTIPIASIKGVAVAPNHLVPRAGMRLPGTGIPGLLRAGSYGTGSARDFWLVRRADELLVIELQPGEPYRRIVLEVPDPRAEALRLRPRLGTYTGSFSA